MGYDIPGVMKPLLDWLQHNKEWVFSGVGIPVATGLFFLLRSIFSRRKHALQITFPSGFDR